MEETTEGTGQRLDIDIATPLFLEIQEVTGKFKSKLIGMDIGRYLVLATPQGQLPPGAKVGLDTFLKVRYVHRGSVFGFGSYVKGIISRPVRMLIIAYPKQVAEQSLRKAERFDCHIPCQAVIDSLQSEGTIVDISMAGCRCMIPVPATQSAESRPTIDGRIELHLHTHEAGEVVLHAVVVNITEQHGAAQLGIRFDDKNSAAIAALEKVIMPFSME